MLVAIRAVAAVTNCRRMNFFLILSRQPYNGSNLKAVLHKLDSDAGRRLPQLLCVFINERDVMQTMAATPLGDWLSSVIASLLAAACDQPDGCYSCSPFF